MSECCDAMLRLFYPIVENLRPGLRHRLSVCPKELVNQSSLSTRGFYPGKRHSRAASGALGWPGSGSQSRGGQAGNSSPADTPVPPHSKNAHGEEKENLTAQALDLSLKYHFVTPLTSMVVTKPEDNEDQTAIADKPGEGGHGEYRPELAGLPDPGPGVPRRGTSQAGETQPCSRGAGPGGIEGNLAEVWGGCRGGSEAISMDRAWGLNREASASLKGYE